MPLSTLRTALLWLSRLAALVSFAALPATGVTAQGSGAVEGYVYEAETDTPLAGASVRVDGTTRGAATDPDGYYRIDGVEPGTYRVVASLLGYAEEAASVTVAAGETARQDFTVRSTELELDGVTVTGLRRGQVRSVVEKREALSVVDVVSADEIGQLPDLNVAESAQRVPGVTIRTDRGEGRFVSIRGTPPNRNNVTFNGQALASAAGTRATALDLVPAEMVSSVQVFKAVTPDQDANALGGAVNVTTLTAFDRPGAFLSATLNGLAHQRTTEFGETRLPFRSSLTAGTRFGPGDAFGVVVAGTASRRDFNTAISSPSSWTEVDGVPGVEEFEREVEDNDRVRYAVNGNLDYRPTPTTSAYLRTHYSLRDESFTNTEVQFDGDAEPTSPTAGRLVDFEVQLDIPTTDIDEELAALTLGLDQEFGPDVTLNVYGTYSRGTRTRRTFQPEWGEDQDFALTYDTSGDFETLVFDDLAAVMDPANYVYTEMDVEFEDLVEDAYQAGADLRYDLRFGEAVGFVKAGGSFRLRDKDIDRNEDPFAPGATALFLSQFAMDPPDPLQGDGMIPVTGDVERFLDFFRQNSGTDEFFFLDPVESAEEEVEVDAFVTEDVYAGYLMGNARVGRLTATGGVRVEATSTTSERYRFVNDDSFDAAEISFLESENRYVDVLPSLHLLYRAADALQLRAAVSSTIGRPDYDELAAFQDVEFEETDPGVFEGAIEQGNPDLSPLRATNLDATVEYYRGPGSLVSVGAFYKFVRDPIYVFTTQQEGVLGRDVAFEVDEIAGFDDRFFEELTFSELRNADSGSIAGVEVAVLQLLDFLPAPLDGLGITSNLALMTSDVTVPGREDEDVPFFGQSDVVLNVAPYYQRGPVQLRAALNYQGAYLDAVSDDAFEDAYGDERTTIDLYGGYTLPAGGGAVQLNAYVRNLTNEAEREYQGVRDRRSYHAVTGRTFEAGVTVVL
jgi:TonB-dependent receptor